MATNMQSLDPGIIENLRQAERKLHDTLPLLDKAAACGIDVTQLRDTHDQMRKQIDAYKRNFFDGTS